VAGKRVLASLVAQALTTGKVQYPGEEKPSIIGVKEWLEFVKWAYQYLEPPLQRQELSGPDGGVIRVSLVGDDGNPD
jgi:hypothetical protein